MNQTYFYSHHTLDLLFGKIILGLFMRRVIHPMSMFLCKLLFFLHRAKFFEVSLCEQSRYVRANQAKMRSRRKEGTSCETYHEPGVFHFQEFFGDNSFVYSI